MSKHYTADLLLLSIAAVWGVSFVLTKNVLELIPPFAFMAFRFAIAFAVMLLIYHKNMKGLKLSTLKKGMLQGSMLFIGIAFQVIGLNYTSASNSAFITGLSVVFVPIISSIMLHKKPNFFAVTGVALSFLGLFFLSGGLTGLKSTGVNIGDLLCLIGSVGFSMHIIFIDKYSDGENTITLSMIQILVVTVFSTFLYIAVPAKPFVPTFPIVWVLLLTGVLGTAIAYSVQNYAQSKTTPTHAAMIIAAEPMFGVFFAMIIPNSSGSAEKLTLTTLIGCICILMAMAVSELKINFKPFTKQGG